MKYMIKFAGFAAMVLLSSRLLPLSAETGMMLVTASTSTADLAIGDIVRIDIESDNVKAPVYIPECYGGSPRFSPDGQKFCYLKNGSNTVAIVGVNGGEISSFTCEPLPNFSATLSWTDYGIWVGLDGRIVKYDINGTKLTTYTTGPNQRYGLVSRNEITGGGVYSGGAWKPWVYQMRSGTNREASLNTDGCSVCPSPNGLLLTNNILGGPDGDHRSMRLLDTNGVQVGSRLLLKEISLLPIASNAAYYADMQTWSGNSNDWIIIPVGQNPPNNRSPCIYNITTGQKFTGFRMPRQRITRCSTSRQENDMSFLDDEKAQSLVGSFLVVALAWMLTLTADAWGASTVVARQGQLKVVGNELCNQYGSPIQLMGPSTHSLPYHSEWITSSSVGWMVDNWHITVLRISMYGDYFDVGYVNDPSLKDEVIRWTDICIACGIYAIIDWHTLVDDRNPQTYQDEAIEFFTIMANRYKDSPNVLYEICNEPNECTWSENIKPYADAVIPAIRAIDPDGVVICGTPGYSGNLTPVLESPLSHGNVLYAYHFYAASSPLVSTGGWSRHTMINDFLNAGLGIFVTEWGTCEYTGSGAFDPNSSQEWLDFLTERNISHVNWQLSDIDETSAVLRSSASSTGGWTTEHLTQSGEWISAYWTANADAGLPQATVVEEPLPGQSRISSTRPAALCYDLRGRRVVLESDGLPISLAVGVASRGIHPVRGKALGVVVADREAKQ